MDRKIEGRLAHCLPLCYMEVALYCIARRCDLDGGGYFDENLHPRGGKTYLLLDDGCLQDSGYIETSTQDPSESIPPRDMTKLYRGFCALLFA